MFIDTHCHLTDPTMSGDNLPDVILRAAKSNVETIICPTANPNDIDAAIKIAETYSNIWCTIGIHPEYTDNVSDASKFITNTVTQNPRVIGIGEIGLDYHFGDDNRKAQIELFEQQLEIARNAKLPVAIHTRDAESDTANILHDDMSGVMHCFTSSWDLARIMLDRGFYFSASGILTFKNADTVRETFSKIPIDRIVIETDAPYCAPVPYRGKSCEPFMVCQVATVLATLHNIGIEKLGQILRKNTQSLYPRIQI